MLNIPSSIASMHGAVSVMFSLVGLMCTHETVCQSIATYIPIYYIIYKILVATMHVYYVAILLARCYAVVKH